jgi:hypothetical protein
MKLSQTIALSFLAFSLNSVATTDMKEKSALKSPSNEKATVVDDVERLNDQILQFNNKRVTVKGDLETKGTKSFILESGGLINDEIVVIGDKNIQNKLKQYGDDAQVRVTGTVRNISVVDVEKQYGWDLDPEVEVELEKVKSFLVADEVDLIQAEEE